MRHSAVLRAITRNKELFMCLLRDSINRLSTGRGVGGGLRGRWHRQLETWRCPAWLKPVGRGICKYKWGAGLTWTSKENASKDPLKGHWNNVVCNWRDCWVRVCNNEHRTKETRDKKNLLNVAFHTWFMSSIWYYVWQMKTLGGILFNSSHWLRNQYLIMAHFWWRNNNE